MYVPVHIPAWLHVSDAPRASSLNIDPLEIGPMMRTNLRVVAFSTILVGLVAFTAPAWAQGADLLFSPEAIVPDTVVPDTIVEMRYGSVPAPDPASVSPVARPLRSSDPWGGPIFFDVNYFRLRHAKGRAHVPLLGSLVAGSILISLDDTDDGLDPVGIAGYCTAAAGITVAPSLGLWCTGRSRKAWLGTGVRAAGLGGIVLGAWWAVEDTEDDGLSVILTLPFAILAYTLPGIIATSLGVGWSLRETPDAFCGTQEGVQVSVRPTTVVPDIGSPAAGLALRLGW